MLKIQEQLQLLQQQYDDSVAQLEELRQKKELTIIRLKRASILTASLAEEQVQWNLDLTECQGTGKIRSLNRGFVIARFVFHIFYCDLISLG